MASLSDLKIIDPRTRTAFRRWLKDHHTQKESVWITVYKANSPADRIRYPDVVEECLCFGWIDSRPRKNDDQTFYLLISPRREKSVWSAVNKAKIKDLIKRKQMTRAGLSKIASAKENGSWDSLNPSDQMVMPAELKKEFLKNKEAFKNYEQFSKSSQKSILEWIYSAKTEKTRSDRIEKTVMQASLGLKANLIKARK